MSVVVLVEASPRDRTGAVVPVYLAGLGSRAYTHRGRVDWQAGITAVPRFTAEIGFNETGWTGGSLPQQAPIRFAPSSITRLSAMAALFWRNAPVTVYVGDDAIEPPVFTVLIAGQIASAATDEGALVLTLSDQSVGMAKPVCGDTFAGTGGLEGGSVAAGRVKRRSWGRVFNVEALLLDKATNLYEVGHPAYPSLAVDRVKDKGREGPLLTIAAQETPENTLTALLAATVPPGGAVAAPSINMLRWWTNPAGPLTADLRGETGGAYMETAPAIAARILAARTTVTIPDVTAYNALRPGAAGFHVGDNSETVANALDRLLLGVSMIWLMQPNGTIQLVPWTLTAGAQTELIWAPSSPSGLVWAASSPAPLIWAPDSGAVEILRSEDIARVQTYAPLKARSVGYQRNYRVQNFGEISAAVTGATVALSKPAAVVPASSAGVVSSYAAATGQVQVRALDGTDITTQATFTVPSGQANIVGNVSTAGVYAVTSLTADSATLRIITSYGGVDYPSDFVVTKAIAGAQGAPGKDATA